MHSDFRLLAATNNDLGKKVTSGSFRSDLYYRLNVFPIIVPPLRERIEDIPLLAMHFLQVHSKKIGKKFENISEDGLDRLMQYEWPGNVRELENVIQQSITLSRGPILQICDFNAGMNDPVRSGEFLSLRQNEKRHILYALEKVDWKVRGPGGVAELLDIHPSTLEFRMKKLGIKRPPEKRRKRER